MKEFKGKNAVVTGAARGIGFALCKELARRGANVLMADIDEAKLQESVATIRAMGVEAIGMRCDVTEYDDIVAMKDKALEAFGSVELLFNNAGVTALGDIVHMPVIDFDFCMKTNVYSMYYGMRVFMPVMIAQKTECHIINTSSIAGLYTDPGMPAYYAAKHATIGLSEAAYYEMLYYNENFGTDMCLTILCPGMTNTDIASCDDRRPEKFKVDKNNPYYSSDVYLNGKRDSVRNTGHGQDVQVVVDTAFKAIEEKRIYAICIPQLIQFINKRAIVCRGEREYTLPGWGW